MRIGPGIGIKGCASRCPSGISYLFRDDFTTDESAPLASPRTAEPGPGTLTLVQTDGQFSIVGSVLKVPAQVTPTDISQQYFVGGSVSRAAGRVITWRLNATTKPTGTDYCYAGLFSDASLIETDARGIVRYGTTTRFLETYNGTSNPGKIGDYSTASLDSYGIVMRATGHHVLQKVSGGSWKLLWVDGIITTNPVYPGLGNVGLVADFDNFRIPDLTYTPTPLASDSFDRVDSSDLGSTDGAGAEESGGSGLAWTNNNLQIVSNKLEPQSAAFSYATVDVGESDVILQGTVNAGSFAGGNGVGFVARFVDTDNYWILQLAGAGGTQKLMIYERTAGVDTERAATAQGSSAGVDYDLLYVVEGQTITGYKDGVTRVTYGGATAHQSSTIHGPRLHNLNDKMNNFVVWPRTLPAADQATLDSI